MDCSKELKTDNQPFSPLLSLCSGFLATLYVAECSVYKPPDIIGKIFSLYFFSGEKGLCI